MQLSMDTLKHRFLTEFPERTFLDYNMDMLHDYLSNRKWLNEGEKIKELEKPGEGNMNLVIRVKTNQRSFILKQARPWVEKYPHIDAPVERNHVEAAYYLLINSNPVLRSFSPEVLGADKENFIIVFNDLGDSADYTYLYQKGCQISSKVQYDLLKYLSVLHRLDCPSFPFNKSMRELNHAYIFQFPFTEDNILDLDAIQPGLMKTSLIYKRNKLLKSAIERLGEFYIKEGPVLIHGDYFPGSWLRSTSGLKVIDPEFGFRGFAEFDLGVLVAHMIMAEQQKCVITEIISDYQPTAQLNDRLLAGFAGTEILRRILGVAQLPLTLSLEEKKCIMDIAAGWILNGKIDFL